MARSGCSCISRTYTMRQLLLSAIAVTILAASCGQAAELQVVASQPSLNPNGPVDPHELYAYKAEKAPIAEMIREKELSKPEPRDPLQDLLMSSSTPPGDVYVAAIKEKLKVELTTQAVKWLDTSSPDDRDTFSAIYAYCSRLFVSRGVDRDCIPQCHPQTDCGAQSARNCQSLKDDYKQYVTCLEGEHQYCEKYGHFNGEKYPVFRPIGETELERIESVTTYCGNIFQWRGAKLPCFRTCTLYEMRHKRPDEYALWKSRQRRRWEATHFGQQMDKDPTDPITPEHMAYTECERKAQMLCQFVLKPFWRECYERNKFNCQTRINTWNDVIAH